MHHTKRPSARLIATCLLFSLAGVAAGRSVAERMPASAQGGSNPYVGLRHGPQLPPGLKDEGGGLISDPYKDKIQFGIGHVSQISRRAQGKVDMLWFELLTHHNAQGQAFWEVLDVLTLPTIGRNQTVFFTLCLLNDKPDPEIAAIVEPLRRGSYVTRTIRAWRANRQTRKFEEIAVKGVKCELQGDD